MKLPALWEIREEAGNLLARILCHVLGHKTPYTRRLTATTCPRCCLVMEEKSVYIKIPISLEMEEQLKLEEKHKQTHPQTNNASVAQPGRGN